MFQFFQWVNSDNKSELYYKGELVAVIERDKNKYRLKFWPNGGQLVYYAKSHRLARERLLKYLAEDWTRQVITGGVWID